MVTVKNLVNGPLELEGGVIIPALGTVTADFSDAYLACLEASPAVEVESVDAVVDERPRRGRPRKVVT